MSKCYWNNSDSTQTINNNAQNPKKGVGNGTDNTTPLATSKMKGVANKGNFKFFDFTNVWEYVDGANNGYPTLQNMPAPPNRGNIAQLKLTVDYATETILIQKDIDGETDTDKLTPDLSLYSCVVELGGKVKSIEALYSDTLDISSIIQKKANKAVKIAIVNATASPDYSKKDLSMYASTDIMSNTVTLSVRGAKMAKTEITVDYVNEVITGTGTYDYKTSLGEWETITFSSTEKISISNFRMGGVIVFRKSATASNAASKQSTDGFATGTIHFRLKATDKAMKSAAIAYSYTAN